MRTTRDEEQTMLVRYLLGELSEADRERVEERYMLDEHCGELLDELETDLVDAYVEGGLTPQQRQHFETRYLVTRERNAALQAAYLSKVYRDRIAAPMTAPMRTVSKPNRWRSPEMSQFIAALAAGLAIIVLGVGSWFLFDRLETKPEIAVVAQAPAPRQGLPLPENPVGTTPDRPKTASATRSAAGGPQRSAAAPKTRPAVTGPRVADGNQVASKTQSPGAAEVTDSPEAVPTSPAGVATSLASGQGKAGAAHHIAGSGITTGAHLAWRVGKLPNGPGMQPPLAMAPHVATVPQGSSMAAIIQALAAKYALTKTTADSSAVVARGDVLTLKKANLTVTDVLHSNYYLNTYRDGTIERVALSHALDGKPIDGKLEPLIIELPVGANVWVTGIDVTSEGARFYLFSSSYAPRNYRTVLLFPFRQGSIPSPDEIMASTGEVFAIQPSPDRGTTTRQPPPPPSPVEIRLGDSIEQVRAALGQPLKIVKLGSKQIYFYPDIKVTFADGKVSEVR